MSQARRNTASFTSGRWLAKRGSSAFGKEEAESILKEVDFLSLKQPRDDGEGAALDEACSGTEAELRDLCGGISSVVPVEILPIFDGTELNSSLWNVLEQVHRGGVYAKENVRVEDGVLVLETVAKNVTSGGQEFYVTSGAVTTSRKFSQVGGRWVAVAGRW